MKHFLFLVGDAAIRATVLLAVTALAAILLRRASAAHRHLLWVFGLLGALCLPVLVLCVPRWNLVYHASPVPAVQTPIASPSPILPAPIPAAIVTPASPMPVPTVIAPAPVTTPQPPLWPWWVIGIWAMGAVLVLARLLWGLHTVRRLASASMTITNGPLWTSVAAASQALPLRKSPDFRVACAPEGAWVPMSWGGGRPTIVLPADAEQWPAARVHAALLHEMAHVQRRDWLLHMLVECICAVYWWHPLVWLAARQVRATSEHACDDLVLACGISPADYAQQLLQVARSAWALRATPVAAVAMVRPSALARRLAAVLDTKACRGRRTPRWTAAALSLAVVCVGIAASLTPVTATETEKPVAQSLRGEVVVIDPGHGGQDFGTVTSAGILEKTLNLAIAQRVRTALEQRGATVFLTRDGDTYSTIQQRVQFSAQKHATLLVSIHCDGVLPQQYGPPGAVVYYHGQDIGDELFAGDVKAGISQATGVPSRTLSDFTRFDSGFGILREARMAAVLVECGDLRIPSDLTRLDSPAGQQKVAEGIAAGVSAWGVRWKRISREAHIQTDLIIARCTFMHISKLHKQGKVSDQYYQRAALLEQDAVKSKGDLPALFKFTKLLNGLYDALSSGSRPVNTKNTK